MTLPTKRDGERVVLITGSARGIGFAIAEAYANIGARIALLDVDEDKLNKSAEQIAAAGGLCTHVKCDVSEYRSVELACREIQDAVGPIDIVVNNAGISPKLGGRKVEFPDLAHEEWCRVVDVNLHGVFNVCRVLTPSMKERRFGRIVNMSSVAAKAYLDVVAAHYSTTKAALIGFTRHLAGELGPYNITVNALAPGRIDTDLIRGIPESENERFRLATPLRRLGTPDDVAQVCLYLTSPQADFVTGQVIDVAGGWLMT